MGHFRNYFSKESQTVTMNTIKINQLIFVIQNQYYLKYIIHIISYRDSKYLLN